jgi:GR25 family glycosyltransferase involved in LPS biosynthesis
MWIGGGLFLLLLLLLGVVARLWWWFCQDLDTMVRPQAVFRISMPDSTAVAIQEKRFRASAILSGCSSTYTFPAMVGKDLHVDQCGQWVQDTHQTRFWSDLAWRHKGHLGATMSHFQLWHTLTQESRWEDVWILIVEDDALPCVDFDRQWTHMVKQLTDEVEVVYLGWHCNYDDHQGCYENDTWVVPGENLKQVRLKPVGYAIGLWGYMIRGGRVARKLLSTMLPVSQPIDHAMMEVKNQIHMRCCVPPILLHPGTTRISSYRLDSTTDTHLYRSQTQT